MEAEKRISARLAKEVGKKWRCKGCGEYIDEPDLVDDAMGDMHHTKTKHDQSGYAYPSICGPVEKEVG
jgi:hypothetical protein